MAYSENIFRAKRNNRDKKEKIIKIKFKLDRVSVRSLLKLIQDKQEAYGPHCSPEKTVLDNPQNNDYAITLKENKIHCLLFSSPEPKAQVSFSDQNLSVVRRCRCRRRRWRCHKLLTFSSSSSEPLGQFQPNLAQSIPR